MPNMNDMSAQEQHSTPKWEEPVDIPVGEILRRARHHYGLSLQDVEQALRIRASQLDALEMMDMNRLPGRVYAIGFVRTYSEFLGLDGGRMVHLFKTQVMDGGHRMATMNYSVSASESKVPNIYILGGSTVALALIMLFAFMVSGDDKAGGDDIPAISTAATEGLDGNMMMSSLQDVQPLESAMMAAIAPAAGIEKTAVMQESPMAMDNSVLINVTDTAWVEIRDAKGTTVISRVLEKGDSYTIPEESQGWVLSTGNAGGLLFRVRGENLPTLGRKGDVLRHIDLDAEALLDKVSMTSE